MTLDRGGAELWKGVLRSDESHFSVWQEVHYLPGCDIWRRDDEMHGAVIQAFFSCFSPSRNILGKKNPQLQTHD